VSAEKLLLEISAEDHFLAEARSHGHQDPKNHFSACLLHHGADGLRGSGLEYIGKPVQEPAAENEDEDVVVKGRQRGPRRSAYRALYPTQSLLTPRPFLEGIAPS
jgi:hypothetical protein